MELPEREAIRSAVRTRYREIASAGPASFAYPTGRAGAEFLHYDPALLAQVPESVLAGFCGVGNVFKLGGIPPGAAVLDVGCGTGFDLWIARALTGPSGRVAGVDATPEMAEVARRNLVGPRGPEAERKAGSGTSFGPAPERAPVEIHACACESLPFPDASFDVVLSNGALNLSPEKERCVGEIHRVLRPGGWFYLSDIIRRVDLPPEVAGSVDAWST